MNSTWVALVEESLLLPPKEDAVHPTLSLSPPPAISVTSCLPDPSSGEDRIYLLAGEHNNNQNIYEIQALSPENDPTYTSFLVGSRVVSNGQLHVITRVDPLFWILFYVSPSVESSNVDDNNKKDNNNNNSIKWQPLNQILDQIPNPLLRSILQHTKEQLQHMYDTTQLDFGGDDDDGTFYKFSESRSLQWLQRKQERVYQVLLTQYQQQQRRQERSNHLSGMFSPTFNCDEEEEEERNEDKTTETTTNNARSESEQIAAKEDSVQIICNYLTPAWQSKFLQHLSCSEDVLLSSKQRQQKLQNERKRKISSTDDETAGTSTAAATAVAVTPNDIIDHVTGKLTTAESSKKLNKPTPRSVGNKQLAKVKTKGMKSLATFFQAKKK